MDFKKTYADDPNRCQAAGKMGQCLNMARPGSQYCPAHGGNTSIDTEKDQQQRNYNLTKYRARLEDKKSAPDIKSLRDEIGILRIIIEERINTCNDTTDLLLQSGPISDLVMKVERVISSCHKLEGSMGQLLDKQAILQFAAQVIDIVADVVTDDLQVAEVANRITRAIGTLGDDDE